MKKQLYPIKIVKQCKTCNETHHNTYVWEKDETGTWINCNCGSTLLILDDTSKSRKNTVRIVG